MKYSIEELISHLKTSGFFFQGSEIYGGLANAWDYGPLGVEIKRNVKNLWWDFFITKNKYNVGLDSAILMNSKVWQASGHIGNFSDPLVDCRDCKSRFRADKMIEDAFNDLNCGGWTNQQLNDFIIEKKIKCPNCGKTNFTEIRQFELMFKTSQGVVADDKSTVYLRPETAQGIFVNFKNVQRTLRLKIPFGVGQIGKSFRNEITPGNFIFRTREFEQMELEFFYHSGDKTAWFDYWLEQIKTFLKIININPEHYHARAHDKEELAHYSDRTVDIEYDFPFGTGELWGLASRTDFDLSRHQELSKQDLSYLDPLTNQKFIPYVIEPSVGVDRLTLAILCEAYDVETLENNEKRVVLHLAPNIAPYQVAVIPLSKQLNQAAEDLYDKLLKNFKCVYDQTGNIGKRYRRQDAIGTPFCITYDFETENDGCVTIRNRDTMKQERIKIAELDEYLKVSIK